MKPNRDIQPPFSIPDQIDILSAHRDSLPNGVQLYTLDSSDMEIIRLSLVFKAGSAYQDIPFCASATLNLLCEGTEKYSAAEIAERMDFYGSYHDFNIDRDYTVVTICSLSKFFEQTLELLSQMIIYPKFPQSELVTYCNKRKQKLSVERTKVAFQARELFAKALYGDNHPYGVSSSEQLYDNLRVEDLKAFHKRYYCSENCFAVCSGKVSEQDKRQIINFLEQLPSNEVTDIKFAQPESQHDLYEPRQGAIQSAIRIGRVLFGRNHPDFVGMQVLSTLLGGYFGSRLVANLREDRGYTYGIYSAMVNFDQSGYLAIATEVAVEVTQDAVDQIFIEMERLQNETVSEQELSLVKNIMKGEIMRVLDGPFGITDVTIENIQNGQTNDYLNTMLAEIELLTPTSLRELAQKYLSRESMVTVVVGEKR